MAMDADKLEKLTFRAREFGASKDAKRFPNRFDPSVVGHLPPWFRWA